MIARAFIRAVGALLLLIYNQNPQILQWSENSAPCPDRNVSLPVFQAFPLFITFSRRQAGVQHGDISFKIGGKRLQHLRGQ